jgi:hypothetical protein
MTSNNRSDNRYMTHEDTTARMEALQKMKIEWLEKLQKAQKEADAANRSLIMLEGAMQDVSWWQAEITRKEVSYMPPVAGGGFANVDMTPSQARVMSPVDDPTGRQPKQRENANATGQLEKT